MATKKSSKQRGHRTHGYGSPKKHRGKGSRGGKGFAGFRKHRRATMLEERGLKGEKGFKSIRKRKLVPDVRTINLGELAKRLDAKAKEADVREMGYDKVLGKGDIGLAVKIKASAFSKSAKEKIEKAGGQAVTE